jgi:predicted phage terminase large subunit-like protein
VAATGRRLPAAARFAFLRAHARGSRVRSHSEAYDVTDLAALVHALEADLYRRSFADYVRRFWPSVTGAPIVWNRAIAEVVAVLQRVGDGELYRVLIAMPSGVGKSTLMALYAGWRLARDPSHRSLHMMHASSLANTESLRVRRLVESDEHRALFPAVVMRADENTIAVWATVSGGRYIAVGQDTSLLGRRALEAVLDDPLDTLDRFSRAAKDGLWAWFSESLMTRLDGDRAPVIVVHQRTAVDDLIGRLIEQGGWHLLELPAEEEDGTLLAPTVLTREKLDDLKQRNPRAYAAMFLQRPGADDGAAIARTAWRFHAPATANPNASRPMGCSKPDDSPTVVTPTKFDRIVISVDMTFGGTKSTNDFCAIQVWGAAGAQRFLLDRWKKKAKQREQRAQIKAYRTRYPRAKILIERAAGGEGAIEELEAEGVADIEGVTVGTLTGGKQARLENVSPTIERGEAFLPLGMHDLAGFVEELAGATRHDDDQDACSQAIHWLNLRGTGGAERFERANRSLSRFLALASGQVRRVPDPPDPELVARQQAEAAARAMADSNAHHARMRDLDARDRAGEELAFLDRINLRDWRERSAAQIAVVES